MEIFVTTLRGILLIECTGGRFGKPWQALFQILLAQITDHMPVLVGQLKALIGRQSRGSRPVPALVAKLCLTNAGILTGCLGVLWLACLQTMDLLTVSAHSSQEANQLFGQGRLIFTPT